MELVGRKLGLRRRKKYNVPLRDLLPAVLRPLKTAAYHAGFGGYSTISLIYKVFNVILVPLRTLCAFSVRESHNLSTCMVWN